MITKAITYRIELNKHKALKQLCASRGVSIQRIIDEAINDCLNNSVPPRANSYQRTPYDEYLIKKSRNG